MVGHDSHAPSPPQVHQPVPEPSTGLAAEIGDDHTHDTLELDSVGQDSSPEKDLEALTMNLERQQVVFVQGKSDNCLVMDHDTHECFFLK